MKKIKLTKKGKKIAITIALILGTFVATTVGKVNPELGKVVQDIVNTIGSNSKDSVDVVN